MSLGSNRASGNSHIRDLVLRYKMDMVANLVDDAEKILASIGRSHYAESTKQKALKECAKYKESLGKKDTK